MKINNFHLVKTIIELGNHNHAPDLEKLSPKQVKQLLKVASSNRILFSLCQKIRQYDYLGLNDNIAHLIDEIIAKGEEINRQYSVVLQDIKKEFAANNIFFLMVKTDRKIEYILSDVDIVISENDFNKAQELLAQLAVGKDIDDKEGRWHYKFVNQVQIDIHKIGRDWFSPDFIDPISIWENTQERPFLGAIYRFPSSQNEWIFNVLNIIYERFTITYLDLLYFRTNKDINLARIEQIAKTHSWDTGLKVFRKYMRRLEVGLGEDKERHEINLPLMFSYQDFLKIFAARFFSSYKSHRISLYFFLYFIYCKIRFFFTKGLRIPFYGNLINF